MPFTKEDVLKPLDVQKLLGLSKTTVAELLRSGKIRHQRAGRKYLISRQAVEDFVNNKTEE